MRGRFLLLVIGIVAVAVAVQLWYARSASLDNDEIVYLHDATLVADGENPLSYGYARGFGVWPLLAGWLTIVPSDSLVALKGFSVALAAVTTLLLFAVFFELQRPWAGVIGVLLYAASPYLMNAHVYIHTQNLQILLLLLGLWLLVRAQRRTRRSWLLFGLAGAAFGYAFVTRESSAYFILVLAVLLLLFGERPLRERWKQLAVFGSGVAVPLIAGAALLVATAGSERVWALYRHFFLAPGVGGTSGSVLKNIADLAEFAHLPYASDLLFLAVLGVGALLLSTVSRGRAEAAAPAHPLTAFRLPDARPDDGRNGADGPAPMRWGIFFLRIALGAVLFVLLATSFKLFTKFPETDCAQAETPDPYCVRTELQSTIAPGLAGLAAVLVLALARRRESSLLALDRRWVLVLVVLLLSPSLSYLQHFRVTISHLHEFYPGVVALGALAVDGLVRRRRWLSVVAIVVALFLSSRAALQTLALIPISGSYTPKDIRLLRAVVDDLPNPRPVKVFTASTYVARLLGGEPALPISHATWYGYPLSDDARYSLFPRPAEIVQALERECNLVVLSDFYTTHSYFRNDDTIARYIEESFTEIYHLPNEERTRILIRKRLCP